MHSSPEQLVSILQKLAVLLSQIKLKELAKVGYDHLSLSLSKYVEAVALIDSPTPSDIANYFEITKPAVTGNIEKLVNMGLVQKTQSNEDRRVSKLTPTDEGLKIVKAFRDANSKFAEKIRTDLNDSEFEQLIHLLSKID